METGQSEVQRQLHVLLCSLEVVEPGVTLAASVIHPSSPDVELLKPGVTLEQRMLARLKRLGVQQIWIEHDLAADLDNAIAPQLGETKVEVYRQLKQEFSSMSRRTISAVQVNHLRQAIMELVCNVVGSGRFANMTDRMFQSRSDLFSHGVNVAHLAILVGLELETYIVRERSRLAAEHARDVVTLGLAGMMHDIGKISIAPKAAEVHELHLTDSTDQGLASEYQEHARLGYEMLSQCRAPASAVQAVLNHHQRFDGTGWPDLATVYGEKHAGTRSGQQLHIFTRILSAANVFDNLLHDAEGAHRPPIEALHKFASSQFDGWFDPVVQRGVLRKIPPFPVGSQVQLSDGRSGVVSRPSLHSPCRPFVRLMGDDVGSSEAINLAEHPDLLVTHWAGSEVVQWLYELPVIESAERVSEQAA